MSTRTSDDDIVDATGSTLPLVIFGGGPVHPTLNGNTFALGGVDEQSVTVEHQVLEEETGESGAVQQHGLGPGARHGLVARGEDPPAIKGRVQRV